MTPENFLEMTANGGSIVSTGQCNANEIAQAREAGRLFVLDNGLGFIFRPPRIKGDAPLSPDQRTDRLFSAHDFPTWNEVFDTKRLIQEIADMTTECDCKEIGYKSCRCDERTAKASNSAVMLGYGAWLSVADKLPEFDKEVLTFSDYGMVIGSLDKDGFWRARDTDYETGEPWLKDGANITHWIDLPQAP